MKLDVKVNLGSLDEKLANIVNDQQVMLAVHYLFAKTIDPWVPFLNGPLSQTVEVEPTLIRYIQPYARYQYFGVNFNHTVEFHPLASALWDKVAMQTQLDSFKEQVRDILVWKAKQLYG